MGKEENKLSLTDDILTGGPIRDLDCERSVIAAMMSSFGDAAECVPVLDGDCFYDVFHRNIFMAIESVFKRGDAPELISVGAELAKSGSDYSRTEITKIVLSTEPVLNPQRYAMRLKELAYRRKMWEIGLAMLCRSRAENEDLDKIQNEAKKGIDSLFEDLSGNVTTLADSYRELQEQMLLNRDREPGSVIGTSTGYPEWDEKGGLMGSDLVVIGAHSSQGKTSFATSLIVSALRQGEPVAVYSMEMTPKQLAARIASMMTGIPSRKISNDQLELAEIQRIDDAMAQIDMSKLFFDGRSTASLDSIITSIRQLRMKYGITGAVVDYLQLVSVKEERMNREQLVAKAARDLKNLAKELGIWIIAISQLNRGNENGVPTMAQLRDSGQIEEAADVVALIHRPYNNAPYPAPYDEVETKGTALIKVEKGRNIGVFDMIAGFRPENTLFYPLDQNALPRRADRQEGVPDNDKPAGYRSDRDLPF